MIPSLYIKAQFQVIAISFYVIIIIQTKVNNCENVKLEDGVCPKHFSSCQWWLNCTSRNISTLRLQCDNPEKITVLYLDSNKIHYIDNTTFKGFIKLGILSLTNNRIDKIESHTFKPLRNIKYLDLRNNLVKEIEENSFQNLTSIFRIDLENNQLIRINSGVFKNCDNLSQVYLGKNNIEKIKEDSFNEKSNVQLFYSPHNRIKELKFLKNLPKLRFLDLSYNIIENIPPNTLLQLKTLQTLDLSHNKLEILNSGTFSELSTLENLSLSYNKLKYLGEGPFDCLHKLDRLDLSNNYLNKFSYSSTFEEHNNVTLLIYIDNNYWYCKFIHAIKQLRWIKLRYDHMNKNISNIDGIPCLDELKLSDRTTSTTKSQLTTLLTSNNLNFTTVETTMTKSLPTSTFLEITMTTFSSSNSEVISTKPTQTTPDIKNSPTATTIVLQEIVNNIPPTFKDTSISSNTGNKITPTIIAVCVLIIVIVIILIIISVLLIRRYFTDSNTNDSEFAKHGYMLPARPPAKRSNFYVTLESYNSYEEINELEHIYEEISMTSL